MCDTLLQKAWHELHLVLLHISHIKSHSGSGSRFVSKFSFLPIFVNSVHRGMYNTSKKSYVQGLDFIFLHLRALSNLWGRHDPKTEKTDIFACNCVISSHRIKCNTCIESFYEGLHFFFPHWWAMSNIWGHYGLKALKFGDLTVLYVVWFAYLL